jgi:6,7-dimethyl-8-ribityllumazine synthase
VPAAPVFALALILVIPTQGKSMNQTFSSSLSRPAGPWRVALVCASWHADIVHRARDAAVQALTAGASPPAEVQCLDVPGAFEIPLQALWLARSGRFDAVIACALVVNGGIYRHEFVASAVIDGLMRVQLDTGVPVFSAVLTPRDFHEHEEHREFFTQHFVKKGREVAQACLQTLALGLPMPVAQAA